MLRQQSQRFFVGFPQDYGTWLKGFAPIQPQEVINGVWCTGCVTRPASQLVFHFIPEVQASQDLQHQTGKTI